MVRRARAVIPLLALGGLVACGSGDPAPTPTPSPTAAPVLGEAYALLGPLPGVLDAADPTSLDPAEALLTGPHFSFSVPAVASLTGTLPAGVATGLHLAAGTTVPAGHRLVLAEIAGPATGRPASPGSPGDVTIAVTGGDAPRPVRGGAVALTSGTLAVVLPADATPVLQVTDAGRTQSLDLTTGRRGTDAVAGYYPVRRGEHERTDATATAVRLYGAAVAALSPQERLAAITLDDLPAELLPWVEGRGWAKPGRAWLVLAAEVSYARAGAAGGDPDVVEIPPAAFAVSGPAGRIPVTGEPLTIGAGSSRSSGGTVLVGDVPASLREVTVAFTFRGTITTRTGPVTTQPYANPTQVARIALG